MAEINEKQKERIQAFEKGDISWYEEEFLGLLLGDKRLNERLGIILESRMNNPEGSIPTSMKTWAKTKGTYRFFANEKSDPKLILDSHKTATLNRLKDKEIVLAVQDTTSLNYANHPETEGLGYISDSKKEIGLHYHPTIAVTVEGTPLGILDSQVWVREEKKFEPDKNKKLDKRRKTPIEEKESFKWLKSYQAICEMQTSNTKTHFVSVCDREADIFELFYEHAKIVNENKPYLVVRARSNRNIFEGVEKYLFDEINNQTEHAEYDIIVPKKKNVPAREATLQIKFKEVNIAPPLGLLNKENYSNIKLYAISTTEVNPPKNVEPIHWFILTTIPVLNFEDAFEKIEWYRHRWVIEIFFKTLKSGCKVENYQFQNFERLQKVIAIDSIIAWRILYLTTVGHVYPDVPASILFEEHEWKALHATTFNTKEVPEEVPKLSVVMRQIGQLGGHIGRKSDGHPGVITMSRGLYQLYSISIIYKLLTCG